MANKHKAQVEQNALRVAQWLIENSAEFEQQGVNEVNVVAAAGLTNTDAKEAIDYLENREDVVRIPKASAVPPQILLKPGRGWPDVRESFLKKSAAG